MANLIELEQWEEGIYQLETDDPVLGGEDGIDNLQAKQLGNRTKWLKAQLLLRALIDSPEFTGTPKVPTAAPGTNNTQAASTAFTKAAIDAAIAALVDSSPGALDTLNELAAALGDDPNFATTITNALALKAPWSTIDEVITEAGMIPDHGVLTQLRDAIQAMITASLTPDASETVKGIIEIATDAEAQALSDDVRALTPKKLADALKGANQSLAARGYQKLPGDLIFQWAQVGDGSTITTDTTQQYSFPIAFPNTCFVVVATLKRATSVNGGWSVYANIDSLSQFTFVWEQAAAGSNFLKNGYVFAIGN